MSTSASVFGSRMRATMDRRVRPICVDPKSASRRVPRSTWIQEAVGDYVRRVDDEAQVEAYFEGYRRIPDAEDEDFKAVERASVKSLRRLSDQA